MNKIAIQVISDIHLEFYNTFPKIVPLAKYLCLAGDIGTISNKYDMKTKKFLTYCSENWDKTFYVLGNHEFYQTHEFACKKTNFEDLELKYQSICSEFNNVYLLSNSSVQIVPGLNIYGTTLWTGDYGYSFELSKIFNDYNMIAIKSTNSNVSVNSNYIDVLSKSQLNLMSNYLDTSITKNIIMTHFPPIRQGSSNPKYLTQPEYIANYFSWNNIYKQLNMSNVIGWISGHTHWSYDINMDGIRFVSNQMGYKNECKIGETGFEPSQVFKFEY
jgi:predicted phosphohydrolase